MRRQLLDAEHPDVAQGLNNVANHIMVDGQFEEAETLFREALTIWRKTLPEGHPDIGHAGAGLGRVLSAQGKHAEAEPLLRESLALLEATEPEGHWTRFRMMSILGVALTEQSKFIEAESLLIRGYEGLKPQPKVEQKRKDMALQHIIELYVSWGRPELASRWQAELTSPNPVEQHRTRVGDREPPSMSQQLYEGL